MPCSNAVARRETSENLQGCPKWSNRSQPLVCRSSPYYEDMWRIYCCLTSFSPIVDTYLNCEDIARQYCAMVQRWRFLWSPYVIGQTIYFLWSPYVIGQTIIFLPCGYYLSIFFLFPRLISAAGYWMSTILPHMVWP